MNWFKRKFNEIFNDNSIYSDDNFTYDNLKLMLERIYNGDFDGVYLGDIEIIVSPDYFNGPELFITVCDRKMMRQCTWSKDKTNIDEILFMFFMDEIRDRKLKELGI